VLDYIFSNSYTDITIYQRKGDASYEKKKYFASFVIKKFLQNVWTNVT